MIYIIDGQEDLIIGTIPIEHIIDDTHKKSLESTLETYDFIAVGDQDFSLHLKDRNRLIIHDEDGSLREFVITEVEKYVDTEGRKVQVRSDASYLDLRIANVIYPNSFKGTASQHAGRALNETGWQVGKVEVEGNKTISVNNHISPYENLIRIAREFEGELLFSVEHDGRKITRRYVDILERIGDWTGRMAEMGHDLDSVRRVEKQNIVTALVGLGPEKEDGTRLEVRVEDDEALQRWGRIDEHGNLKHLIEAYEIESERTEMTEAEARRYTRTALDKRINTQVSYECDVVDLEHILGLENKQIRYGDTIRVKDTKFIPPLYIEARVYEMERSIKTSEKKSIKLGDYVEYTEEELQAIFLEFRKELQERLDRIAIISIYSSAGDIFKNGEGSTELTANTFVGGEERDEEGQLYHYQWLKFDKHGEQDTSFYKEGKTIPVDINDITDDSSSFQVIVSKGEVVVGKSLYTISEVYDGSDGEKGEKGEDGGGSYSSVAYANSPDGHMGFSIEDSLNKEYIGTFTYEYEGRRNYALTTEASVINNIVYSAIYEKISANEKISYKVFYEQGFVDITFVGIIGLDPKVILNSTDSEGFFILDEEYESIAIMINFNTDIDNSDLGESIKIKVAKGSEVTNWTPAPEDFVNDPDNYNWQKVKGEKGEEGEKGDKGEKGEPGPRGVQGPKGVDGTSQYVHIRYSANANGNPMTTTPQSNTQYVGLANTSSSTAPGSYTSYTWSKFKGEQGNQGIQGPKGTDGQTTYTWVKYADTETGSGMSDSPDGKLYIGLAFNKTTSTEGTSASQYTWSLMPQNIEIGGRNLLRNSTFNNGFSGWHSGYSTVINPETDKPNSHIVELYHLNNTGNTNVNSPIYSTNRIYLEPKAGDKITISFDFYCDNASVTPVNTVATFRRFANSTGGSYEDTTFSINYNDSELGIQGVYGRWVRGSYTYAFTSGKAVTGWYSFATYMSNSSSTTRTARYRYREIKVEKGNKATDWTPAPEDIDASIQAVQTTADGKNSIFRQNTQPSTAGRKVGDVWFKSNADNRMYTFNGTSWVASGFGEQAIVADSITANHIKSLSGLNINDQFKVDNQGNVTFAGDMVGGNIEIDGGDLYIRDESGDLSYALPKNNLISDPSFEAVIPDYDSPSVSMDNGFRMRHAGGGSFTNWYSESDSLPLVYTSAHENEDSKPVESIFGIKSIVLNNSTKITQRKRVKVGERYTLSMHVKRHMSFITDGVPRFELVFKRSNGNTVSTTSKSFPPVKDESVLRYSFSFTVPANTDFVEISIVGGSARWFMVDGVQLILGDYMALYTDEGDFSRFINGNKTAEWVRVVDLDVTGSIDRTGVGTDNGIEFSSGLHTIAVGVGTTSSWSEALTFYTNRSTSGGNQFLIRSGEYGSSNRRNEFWISNNGNTVVNNDLYSYGTRDNTTTNSANIHMFSGSGRFARSTSSAKYKLVASEVKANPYNLLDISPKDWLDKNNTEHYADLLTEEYKGNEVCFDNVEELKRIPGIIAEEVEEAGLSQYVIYGDDGEVDGVMYDRLWTLLIPIVRDLVEENKIIKSKLEEIYNE